MQETKLIGYGVDTLLINVRYADSTGQPVKQELDERLVEELDYLQGEARTAEAAVASPWSFLGVLLFVEPHGAGKQWRWLLTSRLLNVCISQSKFNDIIRPLGSSPRQNDGEHLRALFSAVNILASNGMNALIEERRKMPLVAFLQLFQLPIIASNHSSTDR